MGLSCGRSIRFERPTGDGISPASTRSPIGPGRWYLTAAIQICLFHSPDGLAHRPGTEHALEPPAQADAHFRVDNHTRRVATVEGARLIDGCGGVNGNGRWAGKLARAGGARDEGDREKRENCSHASTLGRGLPAKQRLQLTLRCRGGLRQRIAQCVNGGRVELSARVALQLDQGH